LSPGVKLSPGGEILFCPSVLLNSGECSSLGVNEGVNISPRGQSSPLVAKFTPGGEVHPWGPGVKLRMALCWRRWQEWPLGSGFDLCIHCSAYPFGLVLRSSVGIQITDRQNVDIQIVNAKSDVFSRKPVLWLFFA
jgi:hypothetical protein